jgi:hypothetical protein
VTGTSFAVEPVFHLTLRRLVTTRAESKLDRTGPRKSTLRYAHSLTEVVIRPIELLLLVNHMAPSPGPAVIQFGGAMLVLV